MAVSIITGDCRDVLRTLSDESVHCVVTSPHVKGRFAKGTHWRPRRAHWDRAWLEREYTTNLRSAANIASEVGCRESNIDYWLAKHSIPRRSISEVRAKKHWGVRGPANPMFGKRGALNPNYVDGSSPERQRLYARSEGRTFLRSVYERDGFKCVRCASPRRTLHAHHIKPWAGNAALRFDSTNVVTLCNVCHAWVHSNKNVAREYLA